MKIFKSIIKIVAIIICILILWTLFFHYSQKKRIYENTSSDLVNPSTQSLEDILNSSEELQIEKKILSFRKHYYLLSDGILIGEVTGKLFPFFGDALELKDINGNLIKRESQIKRLGLTQVKGFNASFSRLAEIKDSNSNITGYIGEEKLKDFFKLNHIQYFYDANFEKLGNAKPDFFIFCKDYKVFDSDRNEDYIINGSLFSPTSKYIIDIIDNSDVSVEDVVFYTIIENAIINSKMSNSGSSSKDGSSSK
ncbi:MAG: hypothetical protein RR891_01930 [Clostridium sp.]|uniref:hypothetical protein n=1 Tax=Clostridium sp. TaxID=1506 RepID=UPI003047B3AA